jgi:hypothetical protein
MSIALLYRTPTFKLDAGSAPRTSIAEEEEQFGFRI